MRLKWTGEMAAFLVDNAPGRTSDELADLFEARFGVRLTPSQLANACFRFGAKGRVRAGDFEAGHVPWNKGLPQDEWGMDEAAAARVRSGRFEAGNVPHNRRPIGYERVNKDGFVEVKVSDGRGRASKRNYRVKHAVEYERAHGSVPDGCAVVFADGDRRNFDPGNLVAVPKGLLVSVHHLGIPYSDRATLGAAVAIARVRGAARAAAMRHARTCAECGAEFFADHESQARCRACIERGRRHARS